MLDAVERFQIFIFMILSMTYNMHDLDWEITYDWLVSMAIMLIMISLSENLVDWIKHCFVTKFNNLTPDLYHKYQTIVCSDIIASRVTPVSPFIHLRTFVITLTRCCVKQGIFDNNYSVSRRIGFVPLPLACLVCFSSPPFIIIN